MTKLLNVNFALRVVSTLVLVPLAVYVFFYAPVWIFMLGLALLGSLASFELCKMLNIDGNASVVVVVLGMFTPWFIYVRSYDIVSVSTVVALMFLFFLFKIFSKSPTVGVPQSVGYPLFVLAYAVLPFTFFITLKSYGDVYIVLLFLGVWGFDTGAYLTGSLFGRRKIVPLVSPSKTWEGLIGGYVVSFVFLLLVNLYLGNIFLYSSVATFAIVIATSAFFGDLFESMLKRSVGVKDSGRTIPGHGGVLDRMDSIIVALPVFTLYLMNS